MLSDIGAYWTKLTGAERTSRSATGEVSWLSERLGVVLKLVPYGREICHSHDDPIKYQGKLDKGGFYGRHHHQAVKWNQDNRQRGKANETQTSKTPKQEHAD